MLSLRGWRHGAGCGSSGDTPSLVVLYTPLVDRERYRSEVFRLADILRDEIREKGVSIRSLEQKMGVGNSVYQRVLKGRVAMTVDTLLQIADALDMDWRELFRRAYFASSESSPEPINNQDELEQKVLEILRRHGVLPDPEAEG
ncbi:MAG TPA: helix-turn-helix transcriptional regulator [Thermoanaerobaculia bacterium]|jgi:transcriptional regulator with XRE-family HTH domain|nr:helix-turn-helix transcriptional regulator [Thermoanaerobaculia bacterium]